MHIYQGEGDLKDENRALAIPGCFQVTCNKEITMSSGQLSQVRYRYNKIPEIKELSPYILTKIYLVDT